MRCQEKMESFLHLYPLSCVQIKKRRKPFSLRRRVIEKDQYSVTLGVGAVLVVTRLRIHAHKDKQDERTDTAGNQVKQEKPAAFADVMQTTHRHCNAGNENGKIPKDKENISDEKNVRRIRLNFRVFLFCLGFLLQFFPDPGGFRFCFVPGSFSGGSILFEPCQFIFGF